MSFFKKLFSSAKKPVVQSAPPVTQPDVPDDLPDWSEIEAAHDAARVAGAECLDRHWRSVGAVEQDVLSYMISPSFSGGPDWPSTRQAYRVVRRGDSIILATEGLSDPFDGTDDMSNGFEMELFIETADIPEHAKGAVGDVDPFKRSWAFELLETLAKTVANAGGITHSLDQHGVLSVDVPGFSQSHHIDGQVPALFVTDDDCVGVLLGGPQPDFPTRLDDMPLSPVRLVPVVLITAAELAYVRSGGRAAREDLVSRLNAAGIGYVSSLQRASVV
ncbi:suppressor of fused domain protein [Pseudomonas sp. TWP3-1]|uniref:suppressor of fused domain protein n=1 Tax=Pseudomonas sp. TWP3-1 TaxID=2804631 RepID=UPI003CEC530F